jgi:hypothetical protein
MIISIATIQLSQDCMIFSHQPIKVPPLLPVQPATGAFISAIKPSAALKNHAL